MQPMVSVMVVVKGDGRHLRETLESLISQTITDIEIIVVNGGVDEATQQLLTRYSSEDDRIKVFNQQEPGIAAARNQAMTLATGKYCAVADADDISLPTRLERQVAFLETHPEISLCGAWIMTIGDQPGQVRKTPLDDAMIRAQMIFLCPFAHSSVVWRQEEINRTGQIYMLESSEDYDLWARLLPHIRFANLPETLVHYRIHAGQRSNYVEVSDQNWEYQMAIRSSLIGHLGFTPTNEEISLHQRISAGHENEVRMDEGESWLLKLREANLESKHLPVESFERVLAGRWWDFCLNAKSNTFQAWKFIISPLNNRMYPGLSGKIRLLLRFSKLLLYSVT